MTGGWLLWTLRSAIFLPCKCLHALLCTTSFCWMWNQQQSSVVSVRLHRVSSYWGSYVVLYVCVACAGKLGNIRQTVLRGKIWNHQSFLVQFNLSTNPQIWNSLISWEPWMDTLLIFLSPCLCVCVCVHRAVRVLLPVHRVWQHRGTMEGRHP